MPRLHLKKTPAEEERDTRRKARKSSRKHKEKRDRHADYDEDDLDTQRKRRHKRSRSSSPKRESTRHQHSRRYYNNPGSSSYYQHKSYEESDDEAARARMEEQAFEEKMRDALDDDGLYDPTQRLDSVEARLNSYAHIPRRWRGTDEGLSAGLWMEDAREDIGLEPWQMNDDEYAEYIRAGMWRKKNQAEYEERLRRKEERRLRQEREARLREETRRLEREAHVEREKRAAAKTKRRLQEARQLYEERWAALLSRSASDASGGSLTSLSFDDIPWPLTPSRKGSSIRDTSDITKDSVSSFLLHSGEASEDAPALSPKDILRTTMLRFHPDKFEARVLTRVREEDKQSVKDAAHLIVHILNDLLKELRE